MKNSTACWLAVALLAMCITASTAGLAQEGSDDSLIEEIIVTGSRIKRLDPQLPTPVQVYDVDYIENTGAGTIQEFLFGSSFSGPNLFNENSTLSQTAGTANIDTRGFGDDYVVVLLNGRRLPADPLGGDSATNLNLVPLSAVQRIEYVSTGASAIYGADAVQGVINIITKQQFEGIDLDTRYNTTSENDGDQIGFSLSGGFTSHKGHAVLSFEWYRQQAVNAASRPLIGSAIAPDGTDGRSPTGLPGTFVDLASGISFPAPECPSGSVRPAQFTSAGFDCAFDFAPLYDAIPEMDRWAFLATGEYDVSGIASAYGEFRFSRNVTEVRNGAAPAFFDVTGSSALDQVDSALGTDLSNSPLVFMLRRAVDAGPRARDATNTAFSAVAGLRFAIGDLHELDVSLQSIESEMNSVGVGGNLSVGAIEEAIAEGIFDPTQIYSPAFFEANGLAVSPQRQATGTENSVTANLAGELPFDIGGEAINYAFGTRYKDDEFVDRSDRASTTGDIAGGASSNGAGERDIWSIYGELMFRPIDSVEISLAARYDDYDWQGLDTSSGDSASTYQLGISWRPVDSLLLRASAGTGFKAPTLGELFLGRSFGVTNAVDTTRCNAAMSDPNATADDIGIACRQIEIQSVSGGNPALQTEESDNYSVGLVYEPSDNWLIAVDYYRIEVDDKIGSLTVQEIVDNEALFPELVTRVNGSLSQPGAEVRSNLQNLEQEEGDGIDLSTNVNWETRFGSMFADLRVAYLLSHDRQASRLQPLCDDAGTTSEPEWRANVQVGLLRNDWSAVVTGRYIGDQVEYPGGRDTANNSCEPSPTSQPRRIDDYLEVGLNGSYFIDDDTTVAIGVQNLTDEEPPFSLTAAGGWPWFDQALYDIRGRRYYLSLSHSFN